MFKYLSLSLSLLLIACSGGGGATDKSSLASTNPCANPCANPCGAAKAAGKTPTADTGVDWSGYESWTKVSAAPFESKGHKGQDWVDVYVTTANADAYKAMSGPMPQGTAIGKVGYTDQAGTTKKNLLVMAKMAPGYDADNGDWYYAVLSADGKSMIMEGKPNMCVACHSGAKNDYLFGAPK